MWVCSIINCQVLFRLRLFGARLAKIKCLGVSLSQLFRCLESMNGIFFGCGGEVNEGLEVVVKFRRLRALPVSAVGTFHWSDRYVRVGEGVKLEGSEEGEVKL